MAKYKYDAWGNTVYKTGSMADINPYRYRGYRFDNDTGLYYLNSRYYNPKIGRFINADGVLGESDNLISHNIYAYTFNNPISYVDNNGAWPNFITNTYKKAKKKITILKELYNGQIDNAIEVINKTQAIKSLIPGTSSISVGISGAIMIGGTKMYTLSMDNEGNIGVQSTVTITAGYQFGFSGFRQGTVTSANTIYDLEGLSYGLGGNITVPSSIPALGYGAGVEAGTDFAGYDYASVYDQIGTPGGAIYIEAGYTETIASTNIYDRIRKFLEKLKID